MTEREREREREMIIKGKSLNIHTENFLRNMWQVKQSNIAQKMSAHFYDFKSNLVVNYNLLIKETEFFLDFKSWNTIFFTFNYTLKEISYSLDFYFIY